MKQLFSICFSCLVFASAHSQENKEVDFTHLDADITVLPSQKKVQGKLGFTFEILEETDSIFVDAQKMEISNVALNRKEIEFFNDGEKLWLVSDFKVSDGNLLEFQYSASPQRALYFVGWEANDSEYPPQVWTQGQGQYTSNWLPSLDDPTEKLEFDLSFDFPQDMQVISNGNLIGTEEINDSLSRWEFDMVQPMSSYLVAVAAGNYYRDEIKSSSGIPISLYFYQGDEKKVEPTYRHTKDIFDFLEQKIGVAYPWQNYKQVPVRDFLYSGMENTGATIFSDVFVTDSIGFIDRNYVMVNAHELAHQWFGNAVTAARGEDHWLQEGFSTYYALLAEREIFGEDYYYWKLYESAEQLKELSDKGEGKAVMDNGAGSLTYYQKGAWALHILQERIGVEAFDLGIKNFLEKYLYQKATTEDFIAEVEQTSGKDLSGFVSQWLRQASFPGTEALESLKKSEFINRYLSIAALRETPLEEKKVLLDRGLDFPVNEYIGQEVINQLSLENPSEALDLYKKGFETNNLLVRQAIALSLEQIPEELKSDFESLLFDDSYLTKEVALYKLWMNFPEHRAEYLGLLEGVEGFSDKNIRILWLALNLATPQYDEANQAEVITELSSYTAPHFPFLIRQNAFGYLFQLNTFNEQNLKDLVQGSQHQVRRFRSFSREMIQRLLENQGYRNKFTAILPDLPKEQREYLKQLLE